MELEDFFLAADRPTHVWFDTSSKSDVIERGWLSNRRSERYCCVVWVLCSISGEKTIILPFTNQA